MWDFYSLACIAAECDLEKDQYLKVKEERGAKAVIKKHLESKNACIHLNELVDPIVLNYTGVDDPTHEDMADLIKQIKFRPLK